VYANKNITFPLIQNYLLSQDEFKNLSEELGLALSYNMLGPSSNLGLLGFEIGGAVSFADINQKASYWQKVTADHNPPDFLVIPRLLVRKGLPWGIDIGASYLQVPNTNISLVGGEVKLALLEDGTVTPAIGLRAAYSSLIGVSNLSMQVIDASIGISKKLFIFEPYAGVSDVFIISKPNNIPSYIPSSAVDITTQPPSQWVYLKEEDISEFKGTVGLQLDLAIARFAVEAAFSKIPVYSVKLTFGL
jgi:hypothetical protein